MCLFAVEALLSLYLQSFPSDMSVVLRKKYQCVFLSPESSELQSLSPDSQASCLLSPASIYLTNAASYLGWSQTASVSFHLMM